MFGGDTISLILPKLILSVTRDGILTFFIFCNVPQSVAPQFNDNKQARRVQQQNLFNQNLISNRFRNVNNSAKILNWSGAP
jgi:hypothetical protein